jgi:hypothetical protein
VAAEGRRDSNRRCSMSQAPSPRERDRRGFLKMVAAAATLLPAAARAQAPAPPAQPAPATPAPAAPAGPEHSTGEARLLTEVLRARYPDRFNETQWTSIASDVDGDLSGGKRLRAMKLTNGDEPDITFRA